MIMHSRMFRAAGAGAFLMILLVAAPALCSAAQFVLFDVTFTFSKADADNGTPNKSHYYVREPVLNPDRPGDWTAPVDYRNGTVHIRIEVIEKPAGSENTTWTLCYIPKEGKYGCTGTDIYREKGIYEKDVPMISWWQNELVAWPAGIKRMDLVMKDGSGGHGYTHLRPDSEKFFPTKVRITMVQVSAGSTYDPGLVPNLRGSAERTLPLFIQHLTQYSRRGTDEDHWEVTPLRAGTHQEHEVACAPGQVGVECSTPRLASLAFLAARRRSGVTGK
jgi:hypothetical protein